MNKIGKEILYKELSDLIIKVAIDVQKELGAGFLEKVYENAMGISFKEKEVLFEQQKKIEVYFHSQLIGDFFTDIVIENKIILELKAVETLHPNHYAQLLNYLKASKYEVGYVINFGKIPLQFKRLVKLNNIKIYN
ncbi:MAG: GxxExxY protein [Planctomycetia bacterium]|nr:GxxExxY protein [Planctomycetia bacterium]